MFPCKVGSAWEILAPAKLNLHLEVKGTLSGGFHELETLMVPVRIFDQLRWKAGESLKLRIRNFESPTRSDRQPRYSVENDLVLRAVRLLAKTAKVEPTGTWDLWKRIPMQAGLGGGSSDAAAALVLANHCWGIGQSHQQLAELASEIGSDVPFFLAGGPAICRGRGEQVEHASGLPKMHFVVAKPALGLSTESVFAEFDQMLDKRIKTPSNCNSLLEALRRGAIAEAGQWMTNRLESAARRLSPWMERLAVFFERCRCLGHLMTGSGSAYVGVMRSAAQARAVARKLSGWDLESALATSNC